MIEVLISGMPENQLDGSAEPPSGRWELPNSIAGTFFSNPGVIVSGQERGGEAGSSPQFARGFSEFGPELAGEVGRVFKAGLKGYFGNGQAGGKE